jgi:hypothetical protein
VSTRPKLEAALHSLGWKLEGPTQTASGWKATIQRGTASMLQTGPTAEQVLEDLLRSAQEHAEEDHVDDPDGRRSDGVRA